MAETDKMGLNALKCIKIRIPPKRVKQCPQNGKKMAKMTEKCKISEMIKYGEKMTTIDKNAKQCKQMPKTDQNGQKIVKFQKQHFHRFSGSKLPQKMVLAVFTRCLVPEIYIFGHFWTKDLIHCMRKPTTNHFIDLDILP